jgi:hypothetical protein
VAVSPHGKTSGTNSVNRTGLSFIQRIPEERLDRVALVVAVAASIGVEIAAPFERIELRVADVDRQAMDTAARRFSCTIR